MKTEPFTTEELHTRIRKQLGFTQAETGKPKLTEAETGDHVEQHGAAESFSDWLREKGDDLSDEDRWSLQDDGRSGGWCDSESYSERNH